MGKGADGTGGQIKGESHGLGTIILPRPLPKPVVDGVLKWPLKFNKSMNGTFG